MRISSLGCIAGFLFTIGGAATVAAPPATSGAAEPGRVHILAPADLIEVSVLGRQDFDVKERIGEDGTIRVPFLGTVNAANKTTVQLEDDLVKALETGGYYTRPVVKVDVFSFPKGYVTVLGEVRSPGLVPVDRAYRLSEIMARVGGLNESAAPYVDFIPSHGETRRIRIFGFATADLTGDPYVSPGDKIYSPESDRFYLSGQVRSPGIFPLLRDTTFRMALSMAGVTDAGSDKIFTVTRADKKISNMNPDDKVMPGDVIVVPKRPF